MNFSKDNMQYDTPKPLPLMPGTVFHLRGSMYRYTVVEALQRADDFAYRVTVFGGSDGIVIKNMDHTFISLNLTAMEPKQQMYES